MQVSISGRWYLPFACACCTGEPDTDVLARATRQSGVRVRRVHVRQVSFRYCAICSRHAEANARFRHYWKPVVAGTVIAGLLWGAMAFWAVLVVGLPVALVAQRSRRERVLSMLLPGCATAGWAVAFIGWNGPVHTFELHSRPYAYEMLRLNWSRAINIPTQVVREIWSDPERLGVST